MRNLCLLCLLAVGYLAVSGCQLKSKSPAEGWSTQIEPYVKRYCVNNQQCAEVNILLPSYRGEQSATLGAFNEQIQRHLLTLVDAPMNVPVDAALDSVAATFFNGYAMFKSTNTQPTENWQLGLTSSVPLLNSKITTVEAKQFFNVFLGQKSEFLHLISYDFRTEKYLSIADLVNDTLAFRPILETTFCRERQLKSPRDIPSILLPPMRTLPLPHYVGVFPEGIRIVYNAKDYSSQIDLPITDFVLSWEQLGGLADKTKWLD